MEPESFEFGGLYYCLLFNDRNSNKVVITTLQFVEKKTSNKICKWLFKIVGVYDDSDERLLTFNVDTINSVFTFDELISEMGSVSEAELKGKIY